MAAKVDLKRFNNSWYKPGKGRIILLLWYIINALVFNSYLLPFNKVKVYLLRLFGARVGKGVVIKPKVNIKYPWKLTIGDFSWIGEEVWIDNLAEVKIADNCCVSQGAMLLTGNHDYKKATFDLMVGEITLHSGAWVGAKSVVCPGVILHKNAILAVGSVCSTDLQENTINRGNPSVFVKERHVKQ